MYKLELTLWERVQLETTLPPNAPLGDIKQLLRIKDTIGLTLDEKKAIDWRIVTVETQQGAFAVPVWDGAKIDAIIDKAEFEVESEDLRKLHSLVNERRVWPTEQRTLTLKDKLDNAKEFPKK